MRRLLFLSLLVAGCPATQDEEPEVLVPLTAGPPRVGAAEGTLKLPVGTPLAGFTARCHCMGNQSKQDDRDSAYTDRFVESTGFHLRPTIKALWIENGDEHLVMVKHDIIYSFDGFVEALTARLEEATGQDLQGKVTHSANHNHSSYGTFSKHVGLYLGHDKYNQENFERMLDQTVEVALQAWESRTEAAIGVGWAKDWDPNDRVYSDRRGDNDDLVLFDDLGPEQGKKDPYLQVLRVDDANDGSPIAIVMAWGMHPYVFSETSSLATADATAMVEAEVAESFEEPVVAMFLQTAGGDASVRGSDEGWARMETVGVHARDQILDLWAQIPTSSDPITVETTSRAVDMTGSKVRVTRNGAVDWYYPEWKGENNYNPDQRIFDDDGQILSPLDEWYTDFGAVFCGSGDFDFPVGGLPTNDPIYTSCMNISLMTNLVQAFFRLTDEQVALPLDGMTQTYTAASLLSPVPVRYADGTTATEDFLLGFFPGEPAHMYVEQWRHRVRDELGVRNTMLVGYSMDHEGYLLVPEDWMRGGYEPDITFQGPLAGEYIMENVLEACQDTLLTDVKEGFDPARGPFQGYETFELPTIQPDTTPTAGTRLTMDTKPDYYWIPPGFRLDLDIPAQVQRGEVLQLGWIGGDPGVDPTRVTLERLEGDTWVPVRSRAGRVINDDHHDFGVGHTPDPLFPADAEQTHYWWATWQAIGHIHDRPGLPLGTYRLHVEGERYVGGDAHWPWTTEPYEVLSDPFEIVPRTLTTARAEGGVWVSFEGPSDGFRMIDIEGRSKGHNPLRGELTLTWELDGDDPVVETVDAGAPQEGRTWVSLASAPAGATRLTITDRYGNAGAVDLAERMPAPL